MANGAVPGLPGPFGGGGGGFGGGMNFGQFGGGLGSFLGGLFGASGEPYRKARKELEDYLGRGQQYLNPFYQGGVGAIPDIQKRLGEMSDPQAWYNKMMAGYSESPWAKTMQEQARRAGLNAASASGLVGSTPWLQESQRVAGEISSKDMENYLQNVLGINKEYLGGLGGLFQGGLGAAGDYTRMLQDYGKAIAEARMKQEAGEQTDWWNMIGGIGDIGLSLFGL